MSALMPPGPPGPPGSPMSPMPPVPPARPAWTWLAALLGLAAQTLVTVWVTVVLFADALDYAGRASDHGGISGEGFFEGIGSFLLTILAVVIAVFAIALALSLFLSTRRGGVRLAGFIIGMIVQIPLLVGTFGASDDGVGVAEIAMYAGTALVLLGVVSPPTWRWLRRRPLPR